MINLSKIKDLKDERRRKNMGKRDTKEIQKQMYS